MTTKNYFLPLLIAAVVFVPFAANAQITIGSGEAPQSFSVLELISDHTGLRLPQMDNAQRTAMQNTDEFQAEINGRAMGLKIFNTDMQCVQYWSGSERGWISLCDGRTTIDIDPDSPWLNRPPFTGGGFVGRTYFDIVFSNSSGRCGDLGTGSRQAPYKHRFSPDFTEVYSFVGNGDILNLTFGFQNLIGSVPVILDIAQTGNSVTVFFNPALADAVQHRHRSTAYQAVLFATFDVPGQGQRQHTFHIRVADCAPCGAYASNGEWREFMCHNLGANTDLDPFVPHPGLHGHLFRWGRPEYAINAGANIATDGVPAGWNQAPSHIAGVWDMTTRNPCPEGFRVPTQAEWGGVIIGNTRTHVTDSSNPAFLSGVNFGGALFLPGTGWRANSAAPITPGTILTRGSGRYWSSTETSATFSYSFSFTSSAASLPAVSQHLSSMPIRCIAE